jgi:preprotein translocase subunit SecD
MVAEPGDATDADVMVDPSSGQTVRVLKTVELDDHDVARAYPVKQEYGEPAVGVDFSTAGAEKFAKLTAANINRRLAIVFNGSLVSAPTIRTKISASAVIAGGGPSGFTTQQAQAIIDSINARIAPAAGK